MKNFQTPRMTREGAFTGGDFSKRELPKWALVALGAVIGFIFGALL